MLCFAFGINKLIWTESIHSKHRPMQFTV